jgi:alkyldihydroxyacetonephosphate synthase
MRLMLSVALSAILLSGCAARRPAYVVVPRATSRSDEPVTLPLTPEGRQRLEDFLNHAGHPRAADPVPDPAAAEHRRALDALSAAANLTFDTTNPAFRRFCDAAAALCREHGGEVAERGGGSGAWRDAFLRAPYLRDTFVAMGVLSETFETAVTWDRLPALVESVGGAVREALGGAGSVTCRLTHAYPDGAAPYFTVLAPAERGEEAAQWGAITAVAGDAVLAAGGTITHHHAVGRDHRRWYDEQRPEPFAAAWRAAKAALDPDGRLNPGVLWEQA